MTDSSLFWRRADATDADALSRLHRRAYAALAERIGREPEPMAADWSQVLATASVWCIESDRCLMAALVLRAEADAMLIWSVAVDPCLQRQGIGRQLLDFAEEEALQRGVGEIRLYTHEKFTENIRLYKSIGYLVSWVETTELRTLVHMRKHIGGRQATDSPDPVPI